MNGKIKSYLKIIWDWKYAIIPSIFFNLKHLPFSQAIRLPIWINKPHLHQVNGSIEIDAPIKPGMIRLGGWGGICIPIMAFILLRQKVPESFSRVLV